MTSSPSRNPAFLFVAMLALGTALAAHQRDPVKAMVVEKIETRYLADRTACLALQGQQRKECAMWADVRQKVSLGELKKLMQRDEGFVSPDNLPSAQAHPRPDRGSMKMSEDPFQAS